MFMGSEEYELDDIDIWVSDDIENCLGWRHHAHLAPELPLRHAAQGHR